MPSSGPAQRASKGSGTDPSPSSVRGSWLDGERRRRFTERALWLAVAVLAVFVCVDLFWTGYYLHAGVEAAALCVALAAAVMLRRRACLEWAQRWGTAAVAAVITVVALTGEPADGLVIWLALFPPLSLFLFGLRRGLVISLGYSAVAVGLMAAAVRSGDGPGLGWVAVASTAGALLASTLLASLYEQAREQAARALMETASTDQLTGLANRRGFIAGFAARRASSWRGGRPLSLIVFDLDRLKPINDDYGHAAGDAALCHVAALVQARIRGQDLLGRLGGDEFALLLPMTDLAGGLELAEQIAAGLAAQPLRLDGVALGISVSLGVAEADAAEAEFDRLFAAADRVLYAVKQQGRGHARGVRLE